MELGRQVGAMYDLNRESWDIGNTTEQSPHSVQDQLTGQLPVNPTQGEYENSVPNSEGQGEVHDEGDLEESSDSLINPLTPRLYTFHEDLIASIQDTDLAPTQIPVKEDTMDVVTSHWIPREKESSSSKQQFTSDELSAIEDCSMVSMENEVPDHIDVMEAMQNLKVKTKRGRPRKSVSTKINKFFKLPRRKKSKAKGVGLKQISHYCLNNNLSEEESVFETGVLMGLIPIDTKQKSLEKISAQLKSNVGDLAFLLERDMGRVLPSPINETALNLGEGEVIDGPPPKLAKKRRLSVESGPLFPSAVLSTVKDGRVATMVDKGKQKVYEGKAFNNGGIFTPKAIRLMDEGELGVFSGLFQQKVVDLGGPLKKGLLACDLLHHAAAGTLDVVKPTRLDLLDELLFGGREFVSVDEVLHALGLSRKKAVNDSIPSTSSTFPTLSLQ
ncbi:hypothetical protein ACET3Z_025686 [Daucus carota]